MLLVINSLIPKRRQLLEEASPSHPHFHPHHLLSAQRLLAVPWYALPLGPFSDRPTRTQFRRHISLPPHSHQWDKWDVKCASSSWPFENENVCLPLGLLPSPHSLECGYLGGELALACRQEHHPMPKAG